MPGALLHLGATVVCAHGGQATPGVTVPRVMVTGQPVATVLSPYAIAACPFAPTAGNGPCATAKWTVGATRVFVLSAPVLLQAGCMSTCVPTGTPLFPTVVQQRVIGV